MDDNVQYVIATNVGAAEAPIFNDELQIIATHRARIPRTDEKGQFIDRDGKPIENQTVNANWIAKEGVLWDRVVADLSTHLSKLKPNQDKRLKEAIEF